MDALIRWERLLDQIRPYYPKAGKGRAPYELESMLRVHCVQLFYNLSDPATEDMLYEIERVRRFTGISLKKVADETTILNFRHLLERHGLGQVLFESIKEHLSEAGLMLKEGTIVDASIIEAPSSTKNRKRERDPEIKQTRKGNQWHFGMKLHVGVDDQSGLVHSLATTSANMHDLTASEQLLHGEEVRVWGDAGYGGMEKREAHEDRQVAWHIAMGRSQRRRLARDGAADGGVQVQCEGQGGTRLFLCEADVWLGQGALPQPGEERESFGPAAWVCQSAAGRVLYVVMFKG